MTALMKATTIKSGQKRLSVCNAYCYGAKNKNCTCSCGGINHGIGLQKAIENTLEMQKTGKEGVVFNDKYLKEMQTIVTSVEETSDTEEPEEIVAEPEAVKEDAQSGLINSEPAEGKAVAQNKPIFLKSYFIRDGNLLLFFRSSYDQTR